MKKILLLILFLFCVSNLYAGQIIERKRFYSNFNPASATDTVYSDAGDKASGDTIAVNTYSRKSIQVAARTVGEYIKINVEGVL